MSDGHQFAEPVGRELESGAEIPHLEERQGKDGRTIKNATMKIGDIGTPRWNQETLAVRSRISMARRFPSGVNATP